MVGKIYVRDLEILSNLQTELSQFNYGSNKVLGEVARGIADSKEFLKSRMNFWNVELRRREDALKSCLSNDDRDRNCNKESMAVREAQEAIEKLRKLNSRLEQAVGEYQSQANRLQQVINSKIGKAKGDLQRSIEKYRHYLDQTMSGTNIQGSGLSQSQVEKNENSQVANSTSNTGITWSEKIAILEKWPDKGITLEEFERLKLPVSDLQAGTLVEDDRWLREIIENKGYLDAVRDSQEAQNLREAILAWTKMNSHWRSKQ